MSHKITVGLQQKVGRPNDGSLGATCHIETARGNAGTRDCGSIVFAHIGQPGTRRIRSLNPCVARDRSETRHRAGQ